MDLLSLNGDVIVEFMAKNSSIKKDYKNTEVFNILLCNVY